jgi:CheY-like chemotaxis protein
LGEPLSLLGKLFANRGSRIVAFPVDSCVALALHHPDWQMNRPRRPRRPARAPAAAPRNGRHEPPHAHVLVVDDHADTREILLTILKTEGYDVTLAEDGEIALERYRARPADVVLMDVLMPRKDGIAATRELCAEFPGVTVVAMSGDMGTGWHDALAEARAAGAKLTLRKPLEPWVLLRALEGLMAARKALNGLHRTA